jgi:hypothetical protein
MFATRPAFVLTQMARSPAAVVPAEALEEARVEAKAAVVVVLDQRARVQFVAELVCDLEQPVRAHTVLGRRHRRRRPVDERLERVVQRLACLFLTHRNRMTGYDAAITCTGMPTYANA